MKAVVNKYVNARISADTTIDARYYQVPGHVLDIDDIVIGAEIAGNSIWYHAKDDGCFYWSGGFEVTEIFPGKTFTPEEQIGIYGSAVNDLAGTYQYIPGFKGIGAGYKETAGRALADLALIFYVDEKLTEDGQVPATINYRGIELQTDVRPLGITRLLGAILADARKPYYMGGSISEDIVVNGHKKDPPSSYGSRTLMVNRLGASYLLTCYHVACYSLFNDSVYAVSGGNRTVTFPSSKVSTSPNITPQQGRVIEGSFSTDFDYVLLAVDESGVDNSVAQRPGFSDYYKYYELQDAYLKNISYLKYGATTESGLQGHIVGTFKAYKTSSVVVDTDRKLFMNGLIEVSKISEAGDSGAPVFDGNNKLVGYIIADGPASTFILPFAQLERHLSITPKI